MALVHAHDVVVLVGHSRAIAEQVSAWCRSRPGDAGAARLTWCGVMGLFGFVCNDFGAEFHVSDTTGENPVSWFGLRFCFDVCCLFVSVRQSLATSFVVSNHSYHASTTSASISKRAMSYSCTKSRAVMASRRSCSRCRA